MADYDVIDIQAKIAIDIDHVFNILESGSFKANPPPFDDSLIKGKGYGLQSCCRQGYSLLISKHI